MDCFKIEENKGLIRYLNVLPSQKSVDIYVNNKLLYSDVKYKSFTPYYIYGKIGRIKLIYMKLEQKIS